MTERTEDASPPTSRRLTVLLSWVHLYGLIGFVIAEIVQIAQHGTDGLHEATLLNALVWLIGVNGFVTGSGHLLMPDPIADSIGWPRQTPWQWEVGVAALGWGIAGVLCPFFDRPFWLATIIVSSVFLIGAAAGHVRQLVVHHNLSPSNAGPILYTDVAIPVFVITLYATS